MSAISNVTDWFFPKTDKRTLALYRIGLGLVTLLDAGTWFGHLQAFFSHDGYVLGSYVQNTTPYSHFSVFFWNDSTSFVYSMYAILVVSCISLMIGYASRWASILITILYVSFTSRFPLVIYGGSEILQFLQFFAIFIPFAPFLDFKRFYFWPKDLKDMIPAWGVRMIQLNIAAVYMFSSISKLRSETWFNGTELANTLSTRFSVYGPRLLLTYPYLNNILTIGTLALEISAPFLLLQKSTRRFSLCLMFSLHLGILIFMNATYFSEIMFVALAAFLTKEDWEDTQKLLHWLRLKLHLPTISIKRA